MRESARERERERESARERERARERLLCPRCVGLFTPIYTPKYLVLISVESHRCARVLSRVRVSAISIIEQTITLRCTRAHLHTHIHTYTHTHIHTYTYRLAIDTYAPSLFLSLFVSLSLSLSLSRTHTHTGWPLSPTRLGSGAEVGDDVKGQNKAAARGVHFFGKQQKEVPRSLPRISVVGYDIVLCRVRGT